MPTLDTHLMLRAFVDELARCGVQHASASPGSRNTPILLALAREPRIRAWSHIDERVGAFFALGAAKASGRPAVLTCTSGTAAANYLPAVVEAFHARVPLLVLTADRPPELREVGAGQAIDQVKLYGDAVKWYLELDVETAGEDRLRWIRQLACRAYWTALDGRPGPVHLNVPLREPLVLDAPLPEDPVPGRPDGRPWVTRACPVLPSGAALPGGTGPVATAGPGAVNGRALRPADGPAPVRAVVVAGRDERGRGVARAAAALAQRSGLPLLADPLSSARQGATAIATYDLILRDPEFAASVAPELVIRVGDLPTSKPLRTWLSGLTAARQVLVDPEGAWQDPAGVLTEIEPVDPLAAIERLGAGLTSPTGWLERWSRADQAAQRAIAGALGDEISEPAVARLLGEVLSSDDVLFVASSMPIRDVELFLGTGGPLPRVMANRGANGIDGTVSTALGVAAATGRRVVLLIGDVALVHDIGGLLAARRLNLPLSVVLLNNDGGGIFHFLPIRSQADAFEEFVATPPGVDFAPAAQLSGLPHLIASDLDMLRSALADEGAALIEVRTDREQNLALHRRVAEAGLAAVSELSRPAPGASPRA
jgi:2-succinyl-5-enolpyruvyl-6-hydroxy-3-cyclohexene-1-carboxylate synthase